MVTVVPTTPREGDVRRPQIKPTPGLHSEHGILASVILNALHPLACVELGRIECLL